MISQKSSSCAVVEMTPHQRRMRVTFAVILLLTVAVLALLLKTTYSRSYFMFDIPAAVNITKTRTTRILIDISNNIHSLTNKGLGSNTFKAPSIAHTVHRTNQTYVHDVLFKDMPDPCAKPRRNTGVEDLLCMKPVEYLEAYKNPCWMDGESLRCIPYFHLIGICKSGTSDLFKRLYLHPDIIPNNGVLQKETWFWSLRRYNTKKVGNIRVPITIKDFSNNFKSNEINKAVDSAGYHYKITGHGDPMDIWERFSDDKIPQNDPNAKELLWTVAFLVRKVNPDVKLLLMLRDPVQRLYSTYFHWQLGKTKDDFHRHVVRAVPMWKSCVEKNSMRHCIYNTQLRKAIRVPLYSSFYAFHLKEWLRAFPREQILIMRNEDYANDVRGTLVQIFNFLNVSIPDNETLKRMETMGRFYETKSKARAGPMLNETKQMLIELYREPTQELAMLLNDNRFAFQDVSHDNS